MSEETKAKCPVPGCGNEVGDRSRGACNTCYHKFLAAVRAGTITDKQLVDKGILQPSRRQRTNKAAEGLILLLGEENKTPSPSAP